MHFNAQREFQRSAAASFGFSIAVRGCSWSSPDGFTFHERQESHATEFLFSRNEVTSRSKISTCITG
jgi:hypothetical protein